MQVVLDLGEIGAAFAPPVLVAADAGGGSGARPVEMPADVVAPVHAAHEATWWTTWRRPLAVALVAHAALLAGACFVFCAPNSQDEIGSPSIEISLEVQAPRGEASDLPPGPESEASTAAAEASQAEAKPELAVEPTEGGEPVAVAALEKPEPPAEAKPEETATASTASVAAEATASIAMEEAAPAPVAAAPVIGVGRSAERVRANWRQRLVAHLDRNKRYPAGEARRAAEIHVRFTIDRTGHVVSAHIVRSSGDLPFDEAALAMMRRADPVPAPPAIIADEELTMTAPVVFKRARG